MPEIKGRYLLIPYKPDTERDAVAKAWEDNGGIVMRIDRFWETSNLQGMTAALYGNQIFCLVLAQKLNLELISPSDDFLINLPEKWLKRTIAKSTIEDAALFQYPRFIKPIVPKAFSAKVYGSYQELLDECKSLDVTTPIINSEIIEIIAEARAFILDKKVAAISIYEGAANIDDATLFVNRFLAETKPPAPCTYVLDIGLLHSGEWAVIEANAVWGAGLNGCNPEMIIHCIAKATAVPQAPENIQSM